ncbi:hypothetical protein GCM10023187_17370 [Nibrella viscosa]|uniref:Copper-binding protein MbnP-like domain-containing protein n=1 Tax=Nibrella viscosa TaxID=1084524 RepID=A0ABP8K8P3_9BACT
MKRLLLFLIGTAGLLTLGCSRENPTAIGQGQLQLAFEHMVGSRPLQPGSTTYTNGSGEAFTVTTLNYYVTNIRLKRADGSEYVVPQDSSYFLVRATDPASQVITLRNLPEGDYTAVSYLLGVDSLRNTLGIEMRKGVLDPAGGHQGGMYWDWNSGYIHFKLEGTSPVAPATTNGNTFMYHIGLFGGYQSRTLNNIRSVTIPLGSLPARVAAGAIPRIRLEADVLKVFDGPTTLRIAQAPLVMVSPLSASVADNYARMFRFVGLTSEGR